MDQFLKTFVSTGIYLVLQVLRLFLGFIIGLRNSLTQTSTE